MRTPHRWPRGQHRHAHPAITVTVVVLVATGATVTAGITATRTASVTALLITGVALVAMTIGFELAGRAIDGTRPAEVYEAFRAAHHPMGGRRPAGRSPAEPQGRPSGGSTKSNTLLSPTPSTTQPDRGGQSGSLGTSRINVTPAPPTRCERRAVGLGKARQGQW